MPVEILQFTVPSIPVAQPRPRAVSMGGKARVFGAPASHAIHAFKATVRMACQQAYEGAPIQSKTPVSCKLLFVLPRPKMPKKAGAERLPHVTRPDHDNLTKGVVDALSGLLWHDDGQLWEVGTSKVYAAEDEQPHVEITVRWHDAKAPEASPR